ncbi:transcription factor bHLH100 [Arachis duranensis]|uniref:Transcription factor bHLH100 n=1 Tax=Arachis duranensis TaxID=130453 RepID=A0A6P4DJB9_ARADU|nr:transcription factor bHLH100 [Arachis duranensis]
MSMMLALSSPTSMFPNNMEWPLELEEEELSHSHHEYFNSEEYPLLSSSMAKKFNHNANERHRRKKINALYSSLRSILPVADQTKKMSIPATISRVLKYIPELQQQVEELIKKKEELLLRISRQGDINNDDAAAAAAMNKKGHHHQNSSGFLVSSSTISDSEVSIQIISSYGIQKCQVSEILVCLENHYALQLLNASSFDTFGGRLFYNLHFQMEMAHTLDTEVLSEKILSICEKHQRI